MRNNIHYIIKSIFLVIIFGLYNFSNVYAQTIGTKLQDVSISSPNTTPHSGALLELESNNKGMLVPRMTTGQRDAIPETKRTESLFIYNTTTGCFNYWNTLQQTWLSICGTPPPAVFTINPCNEIKINGHYKQGEALNGSNFLTIPVTVTQPGTYYVMVTTTNGYYFTTNGTFPSAGNYTIQLQGVGTPNNGNTPFDINDPNYDPNYEPNKDPNNNIGDKLTFSLNNKESSCERKIYIEKANVSYSIDCNTIEQLGNYYIGIETNDTNKLKVYVTVNSTGYWNMYTNTVNGVSFSGTGSFSTLGNHVVNLLATGTPINSGTNNYTLYSNSDPASSCPDRQFTVSTVAYSINCTDAIINGNYMQDVLTNSSNYITLPINVTATGKTTISTNVVNGISFTSGEITLSALGNQNVVLNSIISPPNTIPYIGIPISGTATTLTVTGSPGAGPDCNITIPVTPQPVAYTMACNGITTQGNYAPGIAMNNTNTMTVTVNATYGGIWNITTDTQNGVSYSGTGTLNVGPNTLTLVATGTPTTGGTFNYTLTSNSNSGSTTCTKSVLYVYRTMKVLGLGGAGYQPASASSEFSTRVILKTAANFSPTGTIPVQFIDLINGDYNQGNALKNLINNNNIDIIFIGYNYQPTPASTLILENFVKNKKGVLLHSQEVQLSYTKGLIDAITGGNVTVSDTGSTLYNPVLDANDPFLNGPFGDVRLKGTGSDVNNSYYVTNLPSNVTVLSVNGNDSNRAFMFRHNTLGYMYCGDSGWVAGTAGNTSTDTWPAKITTTGIPAPKPYNGNTTVYNSYIYANAFAWAIKYVQENTVTTYQIP